MRHLYMRDVSSRECLKRMNGSSHRIEISKSMSLTKLLTKKNAGASTRFN